jgi:hypothetical protein
MSDNLQIDVMGSLLKYHEEIRKRGELQNLSEDDFDEPFREIFKGLQKANFIPSAYLDGVEDEDFRRFVRGLKKMPFTTIASPMW